MNLFQKLRINLIRYLYLLNSLTIHECKRPESKSILWLYDNKINPDGYTLRNYAIQISEEINANLISFGSQNLKLELFINFIKYIPLILWYRNIEKFALTILNKQILAIKNLEYVLVGSGNGFLASIAIRAFKKKIKILEIQHGLLDESYLPLKCHIFYARSVDSMHFLGKVDKHVKVKLISNDLNKPEYTKFQIKSPDEIKSLVFWSKNPLGGISWEELCELEAGIVFFAREQKLNLYFNLHPRDNIFKFFIRHLRIYQYPSEISFKEVLKIILRKRLIFSDQMPREDGPGRKVLHISCFSSSLITQSSTGDLVFNIANSRPHFVIKSYSWIESKLLKEIRNISFPLSVTEIKKNA